MGLGHESGFEQLRARLSEFYPLLGPKETEKPKAGARIKALEKLPQHRGNQDALLKPTFKALKHCSSGNGNCSTVVYSRSGTSYAEIVNGGQGIVNPCVISQTNPCVVLYSTEFASE
jgi:hypothetical protein